MSITLAVIIGIALPAMVQQVPAAERKSRKRGTASTTQSVGSAAGKHGDILVPKALVSAFRACAEAQKARLVAKLKTAKSTQRLLLQIRKRLPSASDPDKRMIAAALNFLLGTGTSSSGTQIAMILRKTTQMPAAQARQERGADKLDRWWFNMESEMNRIKNNLQSTQQALDDLPEFINHSLFVKELGPVGKEVGAVDK